MSDHAQSLGRIAELIIDGSREALAEMVRLCSPHAATEAIRAELRALEARLRPHAGVEDPQ